MDNTNASPANLGNMFDRLDKSDQMWAALILLAMLPNTEDVLKAAASCGDAEESADMAISFVREALRADGFCNPKEQRR